MALFGQGKRPVDIAPEYPKVPTSTLYDWFRSFRNDSGIRAESQSTSAVSIPESPQEVTYLCPSDCDDPREELRMVKREIWKNAKRPTKESAIAIQGFNAYLRAMQIEHSLPVTEDDNREDGAPQKIIRVVIDQDKAVGY